MTETRIIEVTGIWIQVPREPPMADACPVESRIECAEGLWFVDAWHDDTPLGSYGPETFITAFYRALVRDDLGDPTPNRIVIRWADDDEVI